MSQASCLCGAVSWQLEGPYDGMVHCHCSRCRKAHGSLFATFLIGPASSFQLKGREEVSRFESSPGFFRCFCKRCGAVVPGDAVGDKIYVPAGNFSDDPGVRPTAHIFVASKAPWFDIADQLPRFDAYPGGTTAQALPNIDPRDPPGAPRGSCLCGQVAYIMTSPPQRSVNCHCSRCRRARSAAHGSIVLAAVQYTRGEDLLVPYTLPNVPRFSYAFCRVCGSPMPKPNPSGETFIAMGTLDDDPGIRPQRHIYVGSKAPWYEIADNLPQYAEFPA